MRDITDGGEEQGEQPSLGRRLAWFFGIAVVSGLAVAAMAELLRWLLLH